MLSYTFHQARGGRGLRADASRTWRKGPPYHYEKPSAADERSVQGFPPGVGSVGASAFDLTQGFALLVDSGRKVAPFTMPWAAGDRSSMGYVRKIKSSLGAVSRATADEYAKKQEELNKKRSARVFDAGEVALRRPLSFARPAKHLLGDRCIYWTLRREGSEIVPKCGAPGPGHGEVGGFWE